MLKSLHTKLLYLVHKQLSITNCLLPVACCLLFFSCNPSKKLTEGEYFLNKNFIINKDTKVENSDIENYIKQKPNRKILGFVRFHLWLHNRANEDNIKRKRLRYEKKISAQNEKRIAKGKKPKKGDHQLFGEWLLEIGEPPVIYDSLLVKKSDKQIKLFLNNKGYFVNSVRDSVKYLRRKRVNVFYKIEASAPYTINKLDYKIQDEQLKYHVYADSSNTLILKGNNYDVDVIQKERDRITNELNNDGYFKFTKDYIYYEVDTNIGNRKVNLTLGIKSFAKQYVENSDSIVETPHQRFYINNVYIQPDFISKKEDTATKDTLIADNYVILHTKKLKYKTKVLLNAIFIRKGELYQLQNVEDTHKRLSELKAFKSINIFFTPSIGEYLDCYIQLSPILKQSISVESEGTNRSGNLGISGSFVYQNRNLFKGSEVFEFRLKGGLEAQSTNGNISKQINPTSQFNTVEFGPELNVYVPRFLVPFNVKASKRSNPKTTFTSALNYQSTPNYTRNITNFSLGYTWKETSTKRHTINPVVINFVKVGPTLEYQKYLDGLNNKFISNSFSNHLSTSTRYTFTFDNQNIKKQESFLFFKLNFEASGNILRGIYDFANSQHANTFAKDDKGRYTFLDIAYSQYLRSDADFRFYYNRSELNKIIFRVAAGIGKPLANFPILPFERSFFSGGANGMRAWQSRTLGPGSYFNKTNSFDQFGDGQLEANIEYRFKLFKMLNGAFFVDAGNTWLRQPDPDRPGGDFQLNRFYKEIAIGSGVGIRADFNFFIIRFDTGLKIRDPQFADDKRWVLAHLFDPGWKNEYSGLNNKEYNFFAFNIGIGYPF